MDIKNIKFQSKEAKFPDNLYFFGIWLVSKERLTLYFPQKTYISAENTLKAGKKYLPHARSQVHKTTKIPNVIIIISLKYSKKIKLQKSLWSQNPSGNIITHSYSLIEAVDKYHDHHVVVAPVWEKNKCELKVALGINKKAKKTELYKAMQSSDTYISPEAKHAALYSIFDVYSFDFDTNQLVEKSLNN